MQKLGQLHDIDLKLLRSFCVIVEEGSFTAAQATLNISQSALSEYLRSLELRMGARLCQRGPKGFRLYPEGEIVYQAACELFASVETFKKRAADLGNGAGYELSLGLQDGLIEHPGSRIVEAIERFEEYYPDVRLRVETMFGFQLMGRVADGILDVGIGLMHDQFQRLTIEPLYEERAHIYCGRRHPLFNKALKEVTRELIEASSYCHRGRVECFHPDPTEKFPNRGDVAHGAQSHLALILSGRDVGYVPDHLAEMYTKTGRLRALRPDLIEMRTPVVAVAGPSSSDFRLARSLVDCLIDCHMEAPWPRRPEADELNNARSSKQGARGKAHITR